MINYQQIKDKIIQLAQEDSSIELLWVYGSHAKGVAHENSDIDLAVTFKVWEKDVIERRLRPELLALEWQRQLGLKDGDLSILDMNIVPIPIACRCLKAVNYY